MIAARVRQAGLDTSHFAYGRGSSRHVVPPDMLRELVSQCTSVAQILVKVGLPTKGHFHREVSAQIRTLGLDTGHFLGRGWARGETAETHPSLARMQRRRSIPDELLFVENGPFIQGAKLVKRLLAKGWPYRCAWCGIAEWRGHPLVLHLDHINGINNDHRLENLRLLCPNCHSQTDTYCNKRR